MSVELLDKTRKINQLLHNTRTQKFAFTDICEVLSDVLRSDTFVISKKGKILGVGMYKGVKKNGRFPAQVGVFIDSKLNDRLLSILSTKEDVNLMTLGFTPAEAEGVTAIIEPIFIAGERLGTVFICRERPAFDIDDIIISGYGTTVVSLEMMRSVLEEDAEESRLRQVVAGAVMSLSSSEVEALRNVFAELAGSEGILVASKIADKAGITRSVIVNALRKLESAGIIESRSSGMKGTYVRILNPYVFEEIGTQKEPEEE